MFFLCIEATGRCVVTLPITPASGGVRSTVQMKRRYNQRFDNLEKERVMKATLLALAVAGSLAATLVHAQSGADVAKAKGCLNCHEVDKKKVGPAFKDVAAKYKGDKDAQGKLAEKLKEGKGHAKIAASDAELKTVLGYVLSTK